MPPVTATLIEGPVGRQLRILAVPMVWGLMATMSFNVVDTYFVAQLGSEYLAVMSFIFPVVMVLTSVGIGLSAGTSSVIARQIGKGNAVQARRLATDAMTLTFFISLAVSFFGWLTIDPLFMLLGATTDLLPLIREYMSIWYISAPFLLVPMVSLAALRAMGMSHVQGYVMGFAALLNVLLDPLLIFGWFGFPALGLQGAAWATLITRCLMMLVSVYILKWRVGMLINPFISWGILKHSWKMVAQVGIPAMATNVIIPLASAIVVILVAGYGTDAVAGFGIAVRIEPLALIVFYALSGVVGPFFGQNFGAQKSHRLQDALKILTLFCMSFGLALALLLFIFGEVMAKLFSQSPNILQVAVSYLCFVPISYGAYGIVMSANAAFNGLGKPWPAMVLSISRVLLVYLPLAYLFQYWFKLNGLFIASAVTNIIIGVWAWYWLGRKMLQTS